LNKSLNLTSTNTPIANAAQIVRSDIGCCRFPCYVFPVCNSKCGPPKWYYFSAYKYAEALEHEAELINVLW